MTLVQVDHFFFFVISELGKMQGSSAINEIKFKCGICSTPHVISGVGRTIQGKIKYFRNGREYTSYLCQ